MTNFADALKEIAITMEQIPSNRGYPGDLYSQLAARYEKAVDFEGAGSITILAVTTMPGDDVTHPVPDNTGYITEGQFYLRNGRIEPFGSLSRLKQLVNGRTREDHRTIMNTMIQLYAAYRETLEKQSMGFRMSDWDGKLLKYGERFETRDDGPSREHPPGKGARPGLGHPGGVLRTGRDRHAHQPGGEVLARGIAGVRESHGQDQEDQERAEAQRDSMSRFERFLPTLELKKQQLQAEVRHVDVAIRKSGGGRGVPASTGSVGQAVLRGP